MQRVMRRSFPEACLALTKHTEGDELHHLGPRRICRAAMKRSRAALALVCDVADPGRGEAGLPIWLGACSGAEGASAASAGTLGAMFSSPEGGAASDGTGLTPPGGWPDFMSAMASMLRAHTPRMNAFFMCSSSAVRSACSLCSREDSSSTSCRRPSITSFCSAMIVAFSCSRVSASLVLSRVWISLCTRLLQLLKALPTP
mmetsp:Transcript_18984/g.48736  ORF Transcript_18984/g.48736 Transcript_18984/m.48736 type:complete len:201 (+) Transcript_18984:190-792(+)